MTSRRLALLLLVTLWVVLLPVAAQAQAPPRGVLPGQSVTLLPDGRWLLLGGQGPTGPVAGGAFFDPRTGNTTAAPWTLAQARAWHTATLLPDGAILVVGGMGAGAQVLATAELFDGPTQAFYPVANPALTARARHTATLLTDGFLLIAGGVGSTGQVLSQADLLDGQVPTMAPVSLSLVQARQGATATLLRTAPCSCGPASAQTARRWPTGRSSIPSSRRASWSPRCRQAPSRGRRPRGCPRRSRPPALPMCPSTRSWCCASRSRCKLTR
jgi:hypothetical protein